jgi:ubiquinol-cytochrome c reductase cytochrome c1 subunit
MKISMLKRLAFAASALLLSVSAHAASGGATEQAGTDLEDRASLQRGAQLYMNYCVGCHSLKYMRYSRIADDLGLSEEQVMNNLNFTGAKFGEHVISPMPVAGGEKWFGKAPPDLSLIARVRGSDWIYTYLKSFYLDESRPLGWNNRLFPNVSMPNPLWEMQGNQRPVFSKKEPTTRAGRSWVARTAPPKPRAPASRNWWCRSRVRRMPNSSPRPHATSPRSWNTPANRWRSSGRAPAYG